MLEPVLFLSHGAPTLVTDQVPAHEFLKGLAQVLPRPKAIVVVSAHWQESKVHVGMQVVNRTIHDFGGFSDELYQIQWPAPGNPTLARTIIERWLGSWRLGAVVLGVAGGGYSRGAGIADLRQCR